MLAALGHWPLPTRVLYRQGGPVPWPWRPWRWRRPRPDLAVKMSRRHRHATTGPSSAPRVTAHSPFAQARNPNPAPAPLLAQSRVPPRWPSLPSTRKCPLPQYLSTCTPALIACAQMNAREKYNNSCFLLRVAESATRCRSCFDDVSDALLYSIGALIEGCATVTSEAARRLVGKVSLLPQKLVVCGGRGGHLSGMV